MAVLIGGQNEVFFRGSYNHGSEHILVWRIREIISKNHHKTHLNLLPWPFFRSQCWHGNKTRGDVSRSCGGDCGGIDVGPSHSYSLCWLQVSHFIHLFVHLKVCGFTSWFSDIFIKGVKFCDFFTSLNDSSIPKLGLLLELIPTETGDKNESDMIFFLQKYSQFSSVY